MKIYNKFGNQLAVYSCENGCWAEDISRDETDFLSITFIRNMTMDDLKKMQDEEGLSVYDVIAHHSDDIDLINEVSEYKATSGAGEEFYVYIVDSWD